MGFPNLILFITFFNYYFYFFSYKDLYLKHHSFYSTIIKLIRLFFIFYFYFSNLVFKLIFCIFVNLTSLMKVFKFRTLEVFLFSLFIFLIEVLKFETSRSFFLLPSSYKMDPFLVPNSKTLLSSSLTISSFIPFDNNGGRSETAGFLAEYVRDAS